MFIFHFVCVCGRLVQAPAPGGKSRGQNKNKNKKKKMKSGEPICELTFVNVGTFLPVSSTALAKVWIRGRMLLFDNFFFSTPPSYDDESLRCSGKNSQY